MGECSLVGNTLVAKLFVTNFDWPLLCSEQRELTNPQTTYIVKCYQPILQMSKWKQKKME